MRDERTLLNDITDALDRIDSFTRGLSYDSFIADEKTVNAVTWNFLIIGDAVRVLPPALTARHPEIPWRQIAGMRDKLTHACFAVDYELVGKTVTVVLPQFRSVIEQIKKT
jgi:uncharacterized protein with HEPN domain